MPQLTNLQAATSRNGVCCGVLRGVAVGCGGVRCCVLRGGVLFDGSMLLYVAVECVTVRGSMLQLAAECVTICDSMLQW